MATFRIVSERSVVRINATSNVHPIHGEARGLEGEIDAEVEDGQLVGAPTAMSISLPAANLQSGKALEDRELRRRLDIKKYPTISGRSSSADLDGATLHVTGDVNFHGASRTVSGDVTASIPDDNTIVLEGAATFDIRDFGMDPPKILMFKVDPDVAVEISVVAERVR